ncbi:MAG TPA: 7-cyano-7-deazaguanine synthase QueC [Thermodesulfobacteriota bacterium]|nr:7-cyano-7-deazaguanine synthase QueC [Thermodesulfobacteriota bacterium]
MTDMTPSRAVILLSGGIDSTTTLAIAADRGFEIYALTVNYGQRHIMEIEAARRVADSYSVARHVIANVDLRMFGGSALTSELAVPKHESPDEIGKDIPVTYVPARNTVLLSLALAWAEVVGSEDIFIGVNALDYSGYPDCRPDYIAAFERMARLATKAGVEGSQRVTIHAPLMHMTKDDIIKAGVRLGVDYSLTRSCYDPAPSGEACGACDSCLLRLKGFRGAGIPDPIPYRNHKS